MAKPPIRASDAEREAVATRLRTAAGEGRLEPDELDERMGAAFAARTRDELVPLIADLPRRRGLPAARRTRGRPGGMRWADGSVVGLLAANAALVSLWAADVGARHPLIMGDSDFFWPIVPIVASGAAILAKRRRRRPQLTA